MSLSVLLLAAAVAAGLPDEVDQHLAELASPRVQVRHEAERWLVAHLDAAHVPRLASAVHDGDAEVRRRICRILGCADADLTLSTVFLRSGDDLLVEVGEEALKERIARWNPRMAEPGETDLGLGSILADLAKEHGPRALRLDPGGSLDELRGLLERHGGLPIGIAVEAEVADRTARRDDDQPLVDRWNDLLRRLEASFGVGIDLFGYQRDDPAAAEGQGFVRFTPRNAAGRSPGQEAGEEVLVRWCRESLDAAEEPRRSVAARNLAASGWPEALAWMEARFRAGGDEAALEALLAAAAAGRVAPLLTEGEVVRELVRRAGEGLGGKDPASRARATRIIDALRRVGSLGRDGSDLVPAVLAGWEAASPVARWARLAILEGMASPAALPAIQAVVLDPTAPPELRLQGLRAWSTSAAGARTPSPPRELPAPAGILEAVRTPEQADELARLLVRAGVTPPAAWTAPAGLPADWGAMPRAAVFAWQLGLGDAASAAALFRDLTARARTGGGAEELARLLSARVGRGERGPFGTVWASVRRGLQDEDERLQLDRIGMLAGLIPPELGMEVFRSLRQDGTAASDLPLLAVVAGWGPAPEAEFARQRLTVLLREALEADRGRAEAAGLIAAVERAIGGLLRLGQDAVAEEWRDAVRRLIKGYRRGGLAAGLSGDWPPFPRLEPVEPARRDRRLAPGTLR